MIYNSFHGAAYEDHHLRTLWKGCPSVGVFVDIGAGHPVDYSNTYHFERNGWVGLLVEANAERIDDLRRKRSQPVDHAAVCERDGVAEFWISSSIDRSSLDSYWSGGGIVTTVPVARLETILARHGIGIIDLLSLDVEGSEIAAWRSMDFHKHSPRSVIIEHKLIGKKPILDELTPLGYYTLVDNESNLIMIRGD